VRIQNDFTVSLPIEAAWKVLLDVERLVPCVPGATLHATTGDAYRGKFEVVLGGVPLEYEGELRFTDVDEGSHRVVVEATGREARSHGAAGATVIAALRDLGDATEVALDVDLTLGGGAAEVGRDVVADVSSMLLAQFAERLEADVAREAVDAADFGPRYQADEEPPPAKATKATRSTKAAKAAKTTAKTTTKAAAKTTAKAAAKTTKAARKPAEKAAKATGATTAAKSTKAAKSAKSVAKATSAAATDAGATTADGGAEAAAPPAAPVGPETAESPAMVEASEGDVSPATTPPAEARRALAEAVAEPVDLLGVAGGPVDERALSAGALAAIVVMVVARRRGIRVLFGLIAAALVSVLAQSFRASAGSRRR
jgi:carbon monoxide dehydrogenase subunit G